MLSAPKSSMWLICLISAGLPAAASANDSLIGKQVDATTADAAKKDGLSGQQVVIQRLVQRGISRIRRNDFEGALSDLDKALELDPSLSEAHCQRGVVYFLQNKFTEAISEQSKAIELDSHNTAALFERAKAHFRLGNKSESEEDIQKCLLANPKDAKVWDWRVRTSRENGDFAALVEVYGRILELEPKREDAFKSRGEAYRALGMFKLAIDDFTKAIELNPKNGLYFGQRGMMRSLVNQLDDALADLTKTIELTDERSRLGPYVERAIVYSRMGKDAEAERDWVSAKKVAGPQNNYVEVRQNKLLPIYLKYRDLKSAADYAARANEFFNNQLIEQALADARSCAELDEFCADAFYWIGAILDNRGHVAPALESYEKCLEADDRYVSAYVSLGLLLHNKLKRPGDAIPLFEKAINIKPLWLYSHYLAKAQVAVGEYKNSVETLDKLLSSNPRDTQSLELRAEAWFNLRNYEKALADVNQMLEFNANDWRTLRLRGRIKRAQNEFEAALADLDAALANSTATRNAQPSTSSSAQLVPAPPLAVPPKEVALTHIYRGVTLLRLGKERDAKAAFDTALQIDAKSREQLDAEIVAGNANLTKN